MGRTRPFWTVSIRDFPRLCAGPGGCSARGSCVDETTAPHRPERPTGRETLVYGPDDASPRSDRSGKGAASRVNGCRLPPGASAQLAPAAGEHVPRGAHEDLGVRPQRPVGDVEVVDRDHLAQRDAGGAEHLPRTGHARLEVQAAAVTQ